MSTEYSISDLRYLMSRLRDAESGCPWDIKQTYKTLVPHTLEEAYEVVDAIQRGDAQQLSEELGDLLFQIIFYSQLGEEDNQFDFEQIVCNITAKLLRRHPHVFPDGSLKSLRTDDRVVGEHSIKKTWEAIKQQERRVKGEHRTLDDIPLALPSLMRAIKLQKRAAVSGFDWNQLVDVMAKLKEELAELEVEVFRDNQLGIEDELGDLLFSCVNLARHLSVDPEQALSKANNKFKQRFETMEAKAGQGEFASLTADEMEELWRQVKGAE